MSLPAPAPRAGPLVSALHLEQGALGVLKAYLPAYLDEAAAQAGLDTPVVRPHSFACVESFDRFAEEQLPAVVVTSPGTIANFEHWGGGRHAGHFGIAVGAAISTATQEQTHALVRVWCAAIRGCLLQRPSLGGTCASLRLLAEAYTEMPVVDRRSIAAGTVSFSALVEDLVSSAYGPIPPTDPFPTVATTDVTVDLEEVAP